MKPSFLILLILLGLNACHRDAPSPPLFELLPPTHTGVEFNNLIVENDTFNILDFDYIYNGSGLAAGDFNNDGLTDLFFGGNNVSSRLYLNLGGMKFKDITEEAGLTTNQWIEGVTLVDLNHDGLLDIYLSVSSRDKEVPDANLLFINQGMKNGEVPFFEEKAADYGIDDRGYNTQAVFFDYDLDGDLDLFVLSNAIEAFHRNTSRPREMTGKGKSTDKLYKNNGDGTFTNVSQEAGILIEGYGLGVGISDINRDGWPDIYVANDFLSNDLLYINNGDGTFTNKIAKMLKHQSYNSMGMDLADFNNDGLVDIAVLDMLPPDNFRQKTMFAANENYDLYISNLEKGYEPQVVRNTLQLNRGEDRFSEIGQLAGIHRTDWSWAPLFADFDNNGLKDLFMSNGYGKDITDMDFVDFRRNLGPFSTPEDRKAQLLEIIGTLGEVKMPNYIYQNRGDLTFKDVSVDWGIVHPSISNGAVFVDLDNDGDLDLVLNNVNQTAFIYQNNLDKMPEGEHNYLKLSLAGPSPNLAGIGAKITLYHSGSEAPMKQFYEHYPTRGYKSHMDQDIHFGLGPVQKADSLEIIWPDGNIQFFKDIPANQTLKISYEAIGEKAVFERKEPTPLFGEVSKELNILHQHTAKNIVDFKSQRLLPHKYSENGPGLAVADVNGDGLDDFYVGGSAGFPGTLYYQQMNGSFVSKLLEEESEYDDMGALFFDANNDGHPDLYVVSGGNRYLADAEQYQDRLYLNDGKGNFKYDPDALPVMTSSGGVVTAADFDGDGDLDLFVGGRVLPRQYPLPAQSYLLRNDGGKFTDITEEVSSELAKIGMVTAALWSDFDQDGNLDLILVGEWMPITFLKQNNLDGKRTFEKSTIPDSEGWWNSLAAGDFDGDGDIDYIGGNLGLNARWEASTEEPLSLYAKDFDNNGSVDPIMFQYLLGEKFAVPSRGTLTSQLPFMKNRFQSYHQYGVTDFGNFFLEGELDGVYLLEAHHFPTSFIENKGNGEFALHPLPNEAQMSPVYGMLPVDLDGDGHLDLLATGNFHGNEAVTGPYDAAYGLYLKGTGDGSFAPVSFSEAGLKVDGDARALARLYDGDGQPLYLASQFSDSLMVYQSALEPQGSSKPLVVDLGPLDQRAEIKLKGGSVLQKEFYYGEGYLSQSSRKLIFEDHFESVTLIDYQGNRREIKREDLE